MEKDTGHAHGCALFQFADRRRAAQWPTAATCWFPDLLADADYCDSPPAASGVYLAVDDFGAGYNHLAYLSEAGCDEAQGY